MFAHRRHRRRRRRGRRLQLIVCMCVFELCSGVNRRTGQLALARRDYCAIVRSVGRSVRFRPPQTSRTTLNCGVRMCANTIHNRMCARACLFNVLGRCEPEPEPEVGSAGPRSGDRRRRLTGRSRPLRPVPPPPTPLSSARTLPIFVSVGRSSVDEIGFLFVGHARANNIK